MAQRGIARRIHPHASNAPSSAVKSKFESTAASMTPPLFVFAVDVAFDIDIAVAIEFVAASFSSAPLTLPSLVTAPL